MITQEERIIRQAQGYDIGFVKNGKKYWINSNTWNEEKEEKLFQETGLGAFIEETGDKNLVFYDPEYFEVVSYGYLHYIGSREKDIPQPINMSSTYYMFCNCSHLRSLNLSDWDMSTVKDMFGMFISCYSLHSLNLADWDVYSVENTGRMFSRCSSLQSLNIANWDLHSVKHMNYMFYKCSFLYSKYNTEINRSILKRVIKGSNKKQQANKINLF